MESANYGCYIGFCLVGVLAYADDLVLMVPIPNVTIGGNVTEFVNEWSHPGHVISTSGDDTHDIESRKSSILGHINGILCDFRK